MCLCSYSIHTYKPSSIAIARCPTARLAYSLSYFIAIAIGAAVGDKHQSLQTETSQGYSKKKRERKTKSEAAEKLLKSVWKKRLLNYKLLAQGGKKTAVFFPRAQTNYWVY